MQVSCAWRLQPTSVYDASSFVLVGKPTARENWPLFCDVAYVKVTFVYHFEFSTSNVTNNIPYLHHQRLHYLQQREQELTYQVHLGTAPASASFFSSKHWPHQ